MYKRQLGGIAHGVGLGQDQGSSIIVDGQEQQVGPGLLGLGQLHGKIVLAVRGEGRIAHYVQAKSLSLSHKLILDAGGVVVVALPDDKDLLTQAQQAGADLVFLPIYYTEASQILTTANKTGYEPIFFGCDGMDGILDVEGFDTSLAEGLMLLTPFAADAQDEKTQAFVSAYVAAYGETPNQFAADAYDVIYSMYQAVLETGVTGDMDASEICEQLKTGYTSMTFDGLTGTGMTWDASGAVSKDPKAVVIKDGAYAAM